MGPNSGDLLFGNWSRLSEASLLRRVLAVLKVVAHG